MNKTSISKAIVGICIGTWLGLGWSAVAKAAPKAGDMRPVATCADGKTWSNTTGAHGGVCSSHGGVVKWADGSPVKSHTKRSEVK